MKLTSPMEYPMTTYVLATVIVVGCSFSLGCENGRSDGGPNSRLSFYPRLVEVSPFVAFIKSNVDYRADTSCGLATDFSKLSREPPSNDDDPEITKITNQIREALSATARCIKPSDGKLQQCLRS